MVVASLPPTETFTLYSPGGTRGPRPPPNWPPPPPPPPPNCGAAGCSRPAAPGSLVACCAWAPRPFPALPQTPALRPPLPVQLRALPLPVTPAAPRRGLLLRPRHRLHRQH